MHYQAYELAHTSPAADALRDAGAEGAARAAVQSAGRHRIGPSNILAACEVFEGITRRYGKPEFGITETTRRTASRCRCARRSC